MLGQNAVLDPHYIGGDPCCWSSVTRKAAVDDNGVLGAQHVGPSGAFHGCCLYCRSQVGFIGCYWVAFKGINAQENRTEQTSCPQKRCPRRKCVECRLKKGWYFTWSRQHRTDHGADIGGSVRTHGGDRGRRQRAFGRIGDNTHCSDR